MLTEKEIQAQSLLKPWLVNLMMILNYRVPLALAIVVGVIALAAFYWNEARKEVVFLCGNFGKGVSQSSVLRQLDTGNFLSYRIEDTPEGSRINVDSRLNFRIYQCIVELDRENNVTRAEVK